MKTSFPESEELSGSLFKATQNYMDCCEGDILPFDAYCITASMRGFDNIQAYQLLVEGDNFFGCAVICRTQLDSLARIHAVSREPDPHVISSQLMGGKQLRDIKGKDGRRLVDGYLIELLSRRNAWVGPRYRMLNEAVHLSHVHFNAVLLQAIHKGDGLMTLRHVGDSSYIPAKSKASLNDAFLKITDGIGDFLEYWRARRHDHEPTKAWREKLPFNS